MTHPGFRTLFAALAVTGLAATPALAAEQERPSITHPFYIEQPDDAPESASMVVEIPAGSFIKYEINDHGQVFVDRFISMPVDYPANYGSLPQTEGPDGDPLDALVITRAPLHPGSIIDFRPIGYMRMVDGGEQDDKLIGVPTNGVDPTYNDVRDITDLSEMERERLAAFFRVYKQLPESGDDDEDEVEINGFGNADEARQMLGEALGGEDEDEDDESEDEE